LLLNRFLILAIVSYRRGNEVSLGQVVITRFARRAGG